MKRQVMTLLLVSALAVNLLPMAAFAQELPENGEEICEHLDTVLLYEAAGEWIHTVVEQCACEEAIGWYEEYCLDGDGDGFCDLCAAELPCLHEAVELSYAPGEGDRAHLATQICTDCGEEAAFEEACLDADLDGFCDGCEGELPCLHENAASTYTLGQIERTHTVTVLCPCGEELSQSVESCFDEDRDEFCDGCAGALPCLHEDITVTYQPGQKEETHIALTLCSCGEEVDAIVESCEDTDSDGLCDGCMAQLEKTVTLGDVNLDGIIDAEDAGLVLRVVARLEVPIDETMADVDGNGRITAVDAMLILCYAQGQIDTFPALQ